MEIYGGTVTAVTNNAEGIGKGYVESGSDSDSGTLKLGGVVLLGGAELSASGVAGMILDDGASLTIYAGNTREDIQGTGALTVNGEAYAVTLRENPTGQAVRIDGGCESIGANAFKGCTGLTKIRIPLSVTTIDATAFDGCENVLVFGTSPSTARTFCSTADNCTFIAEDVLS